MKSDIEKILADNGLPASMADSLIENGWTATGLTSSLNAGEFDYSSHDIGLDIGPDVKNKLINNSKRGPDGVKRTLSTLMEQGLDIPDLLSIIDTCVAHDIDICGLTPSMYVDTTDDLLGCVDEPDLTTPGDLSDIDLCDVPEPEDDSLPENAYEDAVGQIGDALSESKTRTRDILEACTACVDQVMAAARKMGDDVAVDAKSKAALGRLLYIRDMTYPLYLYHKTRFDVISPADPYTSRELDSFRSGSRFSKFKRVYDLISSVGATVPELGRVGGKSVADAYGDYATSVDININKPTPTSLTIPTNGMLLTADVYWRMSEEPEPIPTVNEDGTDGPDVRPIIPDWTRELSEPRITSPASPVISIMAKQADADDDEGVIYAEFYDRLEEPIDEFFEKSELGLTDDESGLDSDLAALDGDDMKKFNTGGDELWIADSDKLQSFFSDPRRIAERFDAVKSPRIEETPRTHSGYLPIKVISMRDELLSSFDSLCADMTDLGRYEAEYHMFIGSNSTGASSAASISDGFLSWWNLLNTRIDEMLDEPGPPSGAEEVRDAMIKSGAECLDVPEDDAEPEQEVDVDKSFTDPEGPTPDKRCYWKKFAADATKVGLLPYPDVNYKGTGFSFRYWPIGLFFPTPAGLVTIPCPVIWRPLLVISGAWGKIVIFLGICGVIPMPYVFLINNNGSKSLMSIWGMSDDIGSKAGESVAQVPLPVPMELTVAVYNDSDRTIENGFGAVETGSPPRENGALAVRNADGDPPIGTATGSIGPGEEGSLNLPFDLRGGSFDDFVKDLKKLIIGSLDKINIGDVGPIPALIDGDVPVDIEGRLAVVRDWMHSVADKMTPPRIPTLSDQTKLPAFGAAYDAAQSVMAMIGLMNSPAAVNLTDIALSMVGDAARRGWSAIIEDIPDTFEYDLGVDADWYSFTDVCTAVIDALGEALKELDLLRSKITIPLPVATVADSCEDTIIDVPAVDPLAVALVDGFISTLTSVLAGMPREFVTDISGSHIVPVRDVPSILREYLRVNVPPVIVPDAAHFTDSIVNAVDVVKTLAANTDFKLDIPDVIKGALTGMGIGFPGSPPGMTPVMFKSILKRGIDEAFSSPQAFGAESLGQLLDGDAFSGITGAELKVALINLAESLVDGFADTSMRAAWNAVNSGTGLVAYERNVVDSIVELNPLGLAKTIANLGVAVAKSKLDPNMIPIAFDPEMLARGFTGVKLPFPAVAAIAAFVNNENARRGARFALHPFMAHDDLPPWERMDINENPLYTFFLDEFCYTAKRFHFQSAAFGPHATIYPGFPKKGTG